MITTSETASRNISILGDYDGDLRLLWAQDPLRDFSVSGIYSKEVYHRFWDGHIPEERESRQQRERLKKQRKMEVNKKNT